MNFRKSSKRGAYLVLLCYEHRSFVCDVTCCHEQLSNFQMKAIGATLERCDNIAHDVKSQIAPAALSLLLHFTLTCKKQMELCRLEVMAAHSCSRNSSNCTFPTKFLFCIFCCMFLEKGNLLYKTWCQILCTMRLNVLAKF